MPRRAQTVCRKCGRLKRGARCPACLATTPYDHAWATLSTRLIADHVTAHGFTCPGIVTGRWVHEPHPSRDLVVDHIDGQPFNNALDNLRVICRGANTTLAHI